MKLHRVRSAFVKGWSGYVGVLFYLWMSVIGPAVAAVEPVSPNPGAAAFSPDGKSIFIGWADGRITAHTIDGGRTKELNAPGGKDPEINVMAVSPDGKKLVATTLRTLRVFDLKSRRLLFERPLADTGYQRRNLQISADGRVAVLRFSFGVNESTVIDLVTGSLTRLAGGKDRGPAFAGEAVLTYEDEAIHIWRRDATPIREVRLSSTVAAAGLLDPGHLLLNQIDGSKILTLADGISIPAPQHARLFQITALPNFVLIGSDPSRWVRFDQSGALQGKSHPVSAGEVDQAFAAGNGHVLLWSDGQGLLTIADINTGESSVRQLMPFNAPLATSADGMFAIGTARAVLLEDVHSAKDPLCFSLSDLDEQCRYAQLLLRFSARDSKNPLDDARAIVNQLHARDPTSLDPGNEGYHYLSASQRLLDAGMDGEARDAFAWLIASSDADTRTAASLGFARAANGIGDHAAAQRALRALVAQMRPEIELGGCQYCDAQSQLALSLLSSGELPAALAAADEALRVAQRQIDPQAAARITTVRAKILAASGRTEEAVQARERAIALSGATPDPGATRILAESKVALGELALLKGRAIQGDATASDGVDLATGVAEPAEPIVLDLRQRLGALRLQSGRPQAALLPLRAAADAIRTSRAYGSAAQSQAWRRTFELQMAAAWASAQNSAAQTTADTASIAAAQRITSGSPPAGRKPAPHPRHPASVSAVAFSEDGKLAASADWTGTVILWSLTSGTATVLRDPERAIASLAFSRDANRINAVDLKGELVSWRIRDARKLDQPSPTGVAFAADLSNGYALIGADGSVRSFERSGAVDLVGSPDGRLTAVATSMDRGLCIHDGTTGPRCVEHAGKGVAFRLAGIARNGDLVATLDRSILHISPKSLSTIRSVAFDRPFRVIAAQALDPNGSVLALALLDGRVQLVDVNSGKVMIELTGRSSQPTAIAFSADGGQFMMGAEDGSVLVWDVKTPAPRMTFGVAEGPSHNKPIVSIDVSPDGQLIATADAGGVVRVWEARSGVQRRTTNTGSGAAKVIFQNNTRLIAAGAELQFFDMETGAITRPRENMYDHAEAIAGSLAGVVAVAFSDGSIDIFDKDGTVSGSVPLAEQSVGSMQLSDDGRRLLTSARSSGRVRLWDAATGKLMAELANDDEQVRSALLTRRSVLLHRLKDAGLVTIDISTNKRTETLEDELCDMEVMATGGGLVAGASLNILSGGYEICFAPDNGTAMRKIVSPGRGLPSAISVPPTGDRVAIGYDDGSVWLLDTQTSIPRAAATQHIAKITALAFSRDGTLLVSASDDRTADVIDARTAALVSVLGQ